MSLLPALAWFVASLWVRGLALFPDPFGGPAWIQKLGLAGGAGIAVAFAMAKLSAWVDDHI